MRKLKDKDQELILYFICVLIFTLSFYCFVNNYKHYHSLNEKVMVSELDKNYISYKENVIKIENKINHESKQSLLSKQLSYALMIMKKDGVFRLLPGDKLTYNDLFKLNNYFIENIYNGFWLQGLKEYPFVSEDLKKMMDVIINNSTYLEQELLNNSDFFSQPNDSMGKDIINKYHLILKNYDDFSYIILKLSDKLGDIDEKNN